MASAKYIATKWIPNEESFELFLDKLEADFKHWDITDDHEQSYYLISALPSRYHSALADKKTLTGLRSLSFSRLVALIKKRYASASASGDMMESSNNRREVMKKMIEFFHCHQQEHQSLREFGDTLQELSKDDRLAFTKDGVLTALFICGLRDIGTREYLYSKIEEELTFETAVDYSIDFELAKKYALQGMKDETTAHKSIKTICTPNPHSTAESVKASKNEVDETYNAIVEMQLKCDRCGDEHMTNACPHKKNVCSNCGIVGHLSCVCNKKSSSKSRADKRKSSRKTHSSRADNERNFSPSKQKDNRQCSSGSSSRRDNSGHSFSSRRRRKDNGPSFSPSNLWDSNRSSPSSGKDSNGSSLSHSFRRDNNGCTNRRSVSPSNRKDKDLQGFSHTAPTDVSKIDSNENVIDW